ncbi:hypothetical protein C9994_09840 [Marivirga lumbricoides]|uniref:Lipoprotein n=1 Tax=Marivirga lumbricoides TaxID=1046115 RepID=A0A2T4DQ32_9BACT|nr:hypothetical protein C9994_09840 [Marivirga lumbricoides]
MNNYFKNLRLVALSFLVLNLFTACSDDDSLDKETSAFNIKIENNSSFGSILVNQENQSMYFFAGDVKGESNCNGGCAEVWPPVIAEVDDLDLASNLNLTYFGNVTRENGEKQLTYKGWPLYYFSPESDDVLEAPGAVEGDGRGGLFYVAKPDYTLFLGRQVLTEGEDAEIYLVDDYGVTLYQSVNDEENVSNCTGGCANAWPIFSGQQNPVIPSTLSEDDFSMITRTDALGPQLSFKGAPLYFFASDEGIRGNVTGNGTGPFTVVAPEL